MSTARAHGTREGRRIALVLAGGAARGAYEAGVVDYVLTEVAAAIRREVRFDILCGTSVGALNACGLAAWAHEGPGAAARMVAVWEGLDMAALVRADVRYVLPTIRWRAPKEPPRDAGLFDASGLEQLVRTAIPFEQIDANLSAGLLDAVTVSTTHVLSGRTFVFVQTRTGALPEWSADPTIEPRSVRLRAEHALASAAIPVLFRSVRIDGAFHCDGGLRQNVPLSPARRLGADAVLVVNPRYVGPGRVTPAVEDEASPGPLLLAGKTLNALMLDRIDTDLARLESVNKILDAGGRAYGPGFADTLNRELGHAPGRGLRPMRSLLVRASSDIAAMAARFVAEHGASISGLTGRLVRRFAGGDGSEADLLSYLLFDGRFAKQLIALGRADAAARHDELCAFFAA